jgi:streptogramin lyase
MIQKIQKYIQKINRSKIIIGAFFCLQLIVGLWMVQQVLFQTPSMEVSAATVITQANIGTISSCPVSPNTVNTQTSCVFNLIGDPSNQYILPTEGVIASMFNAISTSTYCSLSPSFTTNLFCVINVNPNHDDPNPAAARIGTGLPVYLSTTGKAGLANWTAKATYNVTSSGTLLPTDLGNGKCDQSNQLLNSTFDCVFPITVSGKYLPTTNIFATMAGSATAATPCVIYQSNLICKNILANANYDVPSATHTGTHTIYVTSTGTGVGANWTGKGNLNILTTTTQNNIGLGDCTGNTVYVNSYFNCIFPLKGIASGVYPTPSAGIWASLFYGTAVPCTITGTNLICNNIKGDFNEFNPDLTAPRSSLKSQIFLTTTGLASADWKYHAAVNIVDNPTLNVTIDRAPGQTANSKQGETIKFLATFSSPIDPESFTENDIYVYNSAPEKKVTSIIQTSPFNNTTFEINVTSTGTGFLSIEIPKGSIFYETTNTTLNNPKSLAIDPYDTIFTTNFGNGANSHGYSKITRQGTISTITNLIANPVGAALDYLGNVYYSNNSTGVRKISADRLTNAIFGFSQASNTNLISDYEGNIFTLNSNANSVSKVTPDGIITAFGSTGIYPIDIVVDKFGNVYTSNNGSNNVTKITKSGVSSILGSTDINPYGIDIDSNGNIYTSNYGSDTVTKITPTGVSSLFGTAQVQPIDISVDPNGVVYTANWNNYTISVLGNVVDSYSGKTGSYPSAILTDSQGTVFTGNQNNYSKLTKRLISGIKKKNATVLTNTTATIINDSVFITPFDVSISQAFTQPNPASTGTLIKFIAVFNQAIEGGTFNSSDVILTGTATGKVVTAISQIAPMNGTTFEILVTTTGPGTVIASIPAGTWNYQTSQLIPNTAANQPAWSVVDSSGNLYVANFAGNNVTKTTPAGVTTVFATGFVNPNGMTIDSSDNIYVANYAPSPNAKVFKITPGGVVTTLGTTGDYPVTLVIDTTGNIYTGSWTAGTVHKITQQGVSTIYATISGANLYGMAIDKVDNLYVTNLNASSAALTDTVTKIAPGGVITTYNIPGSNPDPWNVTVDQIGNIYTANGTSNTIIKITSGGSVSNISLTSGTLPTGIFGIKADLDNNIYFTATGNGTLNMINPAGALTVIGTGGPTTNPHSISFDQARNIYVTNSNTIAAGGGGSTVTKYTRTIATGIDSATLIVTPNTASGTATVTLNDFTVTINQGPTQVDPASLGTTVIFKTVFSAAIDPATFTSSDVVLTGTAPGKTITSITQVAPNNGTAFEIAVTTTGGGSVIADIPAGTYGYVSNTFATAGTGTNKIAVDNAGNFYTSNYTANTVTKITPGGVATTLGTTGTNPAGIVVDSSGNVYTANFNSNNVTKITPAGVSTILGTTGNTPTGITIDGAGNVYTANFNSNNVTKITPAGVSTILGTTGTNPFGIILDGAGNIFTTNRNSNDITKITPAGVSTTFATTGTNPYSIIFDTAGNLYTANHGSNNISKITPLGVSTIFATTGTNPIVLSLDTLGNIYTANTGSDNVSKITSVGVSTIIGTTGTSPNGIINDLAGNIYTSNFGTNNITKISQSVATGIKLAAGDVANPVATWTDHEVTITVPTLNVTINQGPTQVDPATLGSTIRFNAVFSLPIDPNTFAGADIEQQ